ncbi:hypothetical protein M0638_17395 [Roseomonas sp. NAR14]|uniref:Inosine/uridine-preferring nucleoside hydrolase domain-containing protein n=1 Tax=Roseomonas acroporae TaxID=2937791 RepID=A0A9X1Y9R9_9PROT|nr:hypothetical protein [Roseomonas acroporae]MCK8786153.1 hypothetical protein [Roseomonas acroporae]
MAPAPAWRRGIAILAGLVALASSPGHAGAGAPTVRQGDCVLVDSDAGLDDLRALAVLVPYRRIVAVVVTEGLASPAGGVRALREFLGPGIPVLQGAGPSRPPDDPRIDGRRLPDWRRTAETLNGTFPAGGPAGAPPAAGTGAAAAPGDALPAGLAPLLAGCERLTVLAIGPWSSFLAYAPLLLARDWREPLRVVAQGSPYPDDEENGRPEGWNCAYDRPACEKAFALLTGHGIRARWVDIPQGPSHCGTAEPGRTEEGRVQYAFHPTLGMAYALPPDGLAGKVSAILRRDAAGWAFTSLWDDLAAFYLLAPDLFARIDTSGRFGGHFEPCRAAETMRGMLVRAMAGHWTGAWPLHPGP